MDPDNHDRLVFMAQTQVVLDSLQSEPLRSRSHNGTVMLKAALEEDIKTWSLGHNSLTKKDYLILEQEIETARHTLDLVVARLIELTPHREG